MALSKFTLMLTHYNSALPPSKYPIYLILNYYNKRFSRLLSNSHQNLPISSKYLSKSSLNLLYPL
ncbi:hypothetical protein SAMN06265364_1203 [Prevotella jejuni]|uniref:Uncharacterized protein n=1 Tax=Prevotella jejuni TaxID=1177574 RepID=A0AA94IVK7_9BACT|nr:hypothetical protein SAMN06265364_1203 [Prevotella jejuni]